MSVPSFRFAPSTQPPGRRDAARLRLNLPARIVLITGHFPCQLIDMSQTGACICVPGIPPAIGASAVLEVNGIEAFGTVVWRRATQFGVKFDERVPMSDMVALRTVHDYYDTIEKDRRLDQAREFVQGRRAML